VLGLRATVKVGDVELVFAGEGLKKIVVKTVERVRVHRLVAVVPPDAVLGKRVLDRELVLGAASRVLAGADDKRAVLRQQSLATANRVLDQWRGLQITEDLGAGRNALCLKPAVGDPVTHANLILSKYSKRRRQLGAAAAYVCTNRSYKPEKADGSKRGPFLVSLRHAG